MSANPITSTLLSLLPTYTAATLPAVVHETATGLLAQSRSRAAVLKPEEEVARGWACAEIAVRRLQTRLNLPAVFSNPPCPPRTYKKLYQYLDRVLVSHTAPQKPVSTPITPKKRAESVINNFVGAEDGVLSVPSSSKFKRYGQLDKSAKKHNTESDRTATDLAPTWLGPAIKHLCRTFCWATAAPHIFVGVVSHLKAQETISMKQDMQEDDLPVVVAAIFLLVLEKMQQDVNSDGLRTRAMATTIASPRLVTQELIALGRVSVTRAGVVLCSIQELLEEQGPSWKAAEWFESVPGGGEIWQDDGPPADDEHEYDPHTLQRGAKSDIFVDEQRSTGLPRPGKSRLEDYGLGAIDWLSETRRKDYQEWKAELLGRIEQMERSQA